MQKHMTHISDTLLQALPIFLDSLVTAGIAILLSVTLILLFGEVRVHDHHFIIFFSKNDVNIELTPYMWSVSFVRHR